MVRLGFLQRNRVKRQILLTLLIVGEEIPLTTLTT